MTAAGLRFFAALLMMLTLDVPARAQPAGADSAPSGEAFALALRDHVVRIRAQWESGETQDGFGFVVGQHDSGTYIVTADHIVRGNLPGQVAKEVSVTWFRRRGEEFPATLLGTHDAQRDVAVLRTRLPAGMTLRPDLLMRTPGLPERSSPVWYVGRAGQWYVPSQAGTVNSVDLDQQIMVDGLNVQVGTSGAPLVAEDGIAGMIVADTIGGIPRAIGIDFIERAFAFWAHPWGLQAATAMGEAGAPPDETAGAPDVETGPSPEDLAPTRADEGAGEPIGPTASSEELPDPDATGRRIARRVAEFRPMDPTAGQTMAAPRLTLSDIDVRTEAGAVLVSALAALEGTDLGRVTARVTAGPAPGKTAVALSFPGGSIAGKDGACRFDFATKRFDLVWDDDLPGFTEAVFGTGPASIDCPDFRLTAGALRFESAFHRNADAAGWSGVLEIGIDDISAQGCDVGPCNRFREVVAAGAVRFLVAFDRTDLDGRATAIGALPSSYWPREAAFGAPIFDLFAAQIGALVPERVLAYLGDAEVSLEADSASAEIGPGLTARAKGAGLTFASGEPSRLTYRHEGAEITGSDAQIGVPPSAEVELRTTRRFDLSELGNGEMETWLGDVGPVTVEASASGDGSDANGSGQLWMNPATGTAMVHAVLESDDPTAFLMHTFLRPLARQSNDPRAFDQAIREVVQLVASPGRGRTGRSYRFEVDADFMNQQAAINGFDLSEIGWLFDDACLRYGC